MATFGLPHLCSCSRPAAVPAHICIVLLIVLHAQVVIADDRQAGYFQHIWRRLSWPHPLRILRQHPFPDNTCFARAIIAPYTAHAQSLLTYKAGSVDEVLCESVVLQGVSRWLRHLFRDLLPLAAAPKTGRTLGTLDSTGQHGSGAAAGLEGSTGQPGLHAGGFRGGGSVFRDLAPLRPSPTQSSPPLQLMYVVWLSRRRFEQQRAPTLTEWQKARVLSDQQQEELVLGLQRAVLQWNRQTCITPEQKDCKKRSVMFALQVGDTDLARIWAALVAVSIQPGYGGGFVAIHISLVLHVIPLTSRCLGGSDSILQHEHMGNCRLHLHRDGLYSGIL